jgi:hypothetical protein
MWRILPVALAGLLLAGCAIKVGHPFPSPSPGLITVGKTDKAFLTRTLGDPYQVGLDSGDETWRWFYAEHGTSDETSKDLSVRFAADGTVKSYSFMSNFPEDMTRIKR